MTLGTIALGWAAVTATFVVGGWLGVGRQRLNTFVVIVLTLEALVVTLLAALWFGSLGAGGWWLLFGLVGILVAGGERGLRSALLRSWGRAETVGLVAGLARYLVAGALLAWLLR